jgi:hypothetical protein
MDRDTEKLLNEIDKTIKDNIDDGEEDVAILDKEGMEMLRDAEKEEILKDQANLYIAGWRPLIGWIGAIGIGFNSILVPILNSFGLDIKPIDPEAIIAMVAGVLGIATMRTYEKNKNIDTKEIR